MYTTSSRIRSKNNAVFATETIEFLLPPANKVWGKVMFSQMFVYPRGGGGSWLPSMHHRSIDWGVCIQEGLHLWQVCLWGSSPGGVSAFRGVSLWGVCIQEVGFASGGSASGGVGQTPRVCLQRGGADPPPEIHGMVNSRTVRILLECILVIVLLSPKVLPYFLCRKQNEEETCLIVAFYDDLYSTPFIG